MINIPEVKLGIVAVSRDCFSVELSKNRREAIIKVCSKKGFLIYLTIPTISHIFRLENKQLLLGMLLELCIFIVA